MSNIEPIVHCGVPTLSFRQIDQLSQLSKGTAFRLFKAARLELEEGRDYYYLPASSHADLIEMLKTAGQVYATTVNLVLLSQAGYEKLRQRTPQSRS